MYRSFEGLTLQQDNFFRVFALSLVMYAGLILLMALLRGFFFTSLRQTLIVMSRHIEYDLRNEIFDRTNASVKFHRRNNTGDLMNRISKMLAVCACTLGR